MAGTSAGARTGWETRPVATIGQWIDSTEQAPVYTRHTKGHNRIATIMFEKRRDFYEGKLMILATFQTSGELPYSQWFTLESARTIYGRRQAHRNASERPHSDSEV